MGSCSLAADSARLRHAVTATNGDWQCHFVQWSDPHIFDAGAARHAEGIDEEQLDNWSALHWAVLETNKLVLEDHRNIDFVVITGDFGLYNVVLPPLAGAPAEACQRDPKEGPGPPLSLNEAARLVARELRALVVKRVFLVPGNNDLCEEDPANMYRWAEFVFRLQNELQLQQAEQKANLECAAQAIEAANRKKSGKASLVTPAVLTPEPVTVVDLTFTLEKLYSKNFRLKNLLQTPLPAFQPTPCNLGGSPSSKQGNGPPANSTAFSLNAVVPGSATLFLPLPEPPEINGFRLLGLNSAYFKPHPDAAEQKRALDQSKMDINDLQRRMSTGGSFLLFTHVPDIEDPFPGREKADEGSSWKILKETRDTWKKLLKRPELIAVFAGHFHAGKRELYPHNFSYAKQPLNSDSAAKTWVAPPLAIKYQDGLPQPKTARGILLVHVATSGAMRVSADASEDSPPTPIWFAINDQKTAIAQDYALAAARADEADGKWDDAAAKYRTIFENSSLDSPTRVTALAGYSRCQERMNRWWWRSPLSRWFYVHGWAVLYTCGIIAALLVLYALLRWFRLLRLSLLVLKLFLVPRFKGKAVVNATLKMTPDAPAEVFPAELLAAGEEIRLRLEREQEAWAARHISFLVPSSASFNSLLGSIPKVKEVDVSGWLKFLAALLSAFQWNVDSGIAVLQPPNAPATAPAASGATPPLPAQGELSGYAVLQWGWFVKNSWHRKAELTGDRSAIRRLALQLADLIMGQAFQ